MKTNYAGEHQNAGKYTWKKKCGSKIQASISGDKIMRVPHRIHSAIKKPRHVFTKTTKKPSITLLTASVSAAPSGIINLIDTFDRRGSATAETTYANSGIYANAFNNEPGKRIAKAGIFAKAGVGRVHAAYSVFEAEAKGPNAVAAAEASVKGVSVVARAEIASASAAVGPVIAKIGLGVDTGISAGVDGFEAKFLGSGVSFGTTKISVSFLGSGFSLGF